MIPVESLATFFAASVLLGMMPGPDNTFVMTQSVLNGRGAGLWVTLGLCTGLGVHTTAVALGVAVVFQASAIAFTVLKSVGAVYLLYLAWEAFKVSSALPVDVRVTKPSTARLYRRGIIMNVTNPKVSIFFLAFLPQFTDPHRGSMGVQVFVLGVVFTLATVIVFGGLALLAGLLGRWLAQSRRAQVIANRMVGVVFIGLAIKLAATERWL